jgi:four helix bundle protein
MKQDNAILERPYSFALRIIRLYKYMTEQKKEFVISKQALRSGTSIGANVEEAVGGHTKKDFAAKMSVAYKEPRETHYWLPLMRDSGYAPDIDISSVLLDCEEILKLEGSVIKPIKRKNS